MRRLLLTENEHALLSVCLQIAAEKFADNAQAFRDHAHHAIWQIILGEEADIGPHQCIALAQTFDNQHSEALALLRRL